MKTSDDWVRETQRKGLITWIQDALFGYDLFISYAWADGGKFAGQLHGEITALGLRVFLDRRELRQSQSLAGGLARGLRRSTATLLLLTPQAAKNAWVRREVEATLSRGRRVVVVAFGQLVHIEGMAPEFLERLAAGLQFQESAGSLGGALRNELASEIVKNHKGLRKEALANRVFVVVGLMLAALAATATTFGYVAESRRLALVEENDAAVSLVLAQRSKSVQGELPQLAVQLAAAAVRQTLGAHGFVVPEARKRLEESLYQIHGASVEERKIDATSAAFLESGDVITAGPTAAPPGHKKLHIEVEEAGPLIAACDLAQRVLIGGSNGRITLHQVGSSAASQAPIIVVDDPHRATLGSGMEVAAMTALTWSPDGRYIMTAGVDSTLKLWSVDPEAPGLARDPVRTANVDPQPPFELSLSADLAVIAAGNGRVYTWRYLETGAEPVLLQDLRTGCLVDLHHSGRIAAGSYDGSVFVVDPDGSFQKVGQHDGAVTAIQLSGDGQAIVTGDAQGNLGYWSLEPDPVEHDLIQVAAHDAEVLAVRMDAGVLRSVCAKGSVRGWSVRKSSPGASPARFFPDGFQPAAIHWESLGERCWVGGSGPGLATWSAASGWSLAELPQPSVSVGFQSSAVAWCTAEGELFSAALGGAGTVLDPETRGRVKAPTRSSIVIDADGTLAVASDKGIVKLFTPGSTPLLLNAGDAWTSALAFAGTSNSRVLVVADREGVVRAWPLGSATEREPAGQWTFKATDDPISCIAVHPGPSSVVAAADSSGRLMVFDAAVTGPTLPRESEAPETTWIYSMGWTSEGLLATMSMDRELRLYRYDPADGLVEAGRRTARSTSMPASIDLARTQPLVANGGVFGSPAFVEVFEVDRGLPRLRLELPVSNSSVAAVRFSDDGSRLAVADGSGQLLVLDFSIDRNLIAAKTAVGRELTPAESARWRAMLRR